MNPETTLCSIIDGYMFEGEVKESELPAIELLRVYATENSYSWIKNNKEKWRKYQKEYHKQRRLSDPEFRKRKQEASKKHPVSKEYFREWWANNKDKAKSYQRRYFLLHKDKINERRKLKRAMKKKDGSSPSQD